MFSALNESVIGRAVTEGVISINVYNIRDYSVDKHKKCDDYPFGGGAGMVMMPQPICDAFSVVDPERKSLRIYMSPKGRVLNQSLAAEIAEMGEVTILCGHYEGVDQRAIDLEIDMEISIGDYVLTGGELPAMVLIDAAVRHIPRVLGSEESIEEESFSDGLLEYPHYTRPQVFRGIAVPEVLLSGHHENIKKWRAEKSVELTKKYRKDLLKKKKSVITEPKK